MKRGRVIAFHVPAKRRIKALFSNEPDICADVERIGLWEGRPYLILSLGTGELAAFRISDGTVETEAVASGR